MPARVILNRVFAYVVKDMDREQREEFEGELYAPMDGLTAAEDQLWAAIDQAAQQESAGVDDNGRLPRNDLR